MGGAETVLLDMLASLRAAERAWPLLLVCAADGPLLSRARTLGVDVTVVPFPPALARLGESASPGAVGAARLAARMARAAAPTARYVAAVRDALSAFEPDLLHTNGLKMHLVGAYASDAPVVWHLHEYLSTRRVSRRLLRRNVGRCAAVVANSDSVAADVRATLGPAVEVTRLYNAVDLARFSPAGQRLDVDRLSALSAAPAGTVRVGLVGTFARWKGHETFLRAIASLPASSPVRGYVVGGPIYQTDGSQCSLDELRALASQLGLADRVGFTGFVDRVDAALRALDVVVHASTSPEPFGLVIAEAMACGRATIVSAAGGATELVTPGVDAVTHTPGDVAALADAITGLVSDPAGRAALGAAARQTAERCFDRARLAGELIQIYDASTLRPPMNGQYVTSVFRRTAKRSG